jgi:hypothetical protein
LAAVCCANGNLSGLSAQNGGKAGAAGLPSVQVQMCRRPPSAQIRPSAQYKSGRRHNDHHRHRYCHVDPEDCTVNGVSLCRWPGYRPTQVPYADGQAGGTGTFFHIYANLFISFKYLIFLFMYYSQVFIPIAEIRTPPRNYVNVITCVCTLSRRVGECPHDMFVSTCCVHKLLLDRILNPRVCPLHACTCADGVYSETLARCTRAVYPLRFFWTAASWGT